MNQLVLKNQDLRGYRLFQSPFPESTVLPPKPAPFLEEYCFKESLSDEESLDSELGFVNVGKTEKIQENKSSHVEGSA